ncbi:hypothetical protein GCM10011352_07530 [Marinobacterium zhoushanense]|uniref:PAS domain S-box-containing protein/diguanylate cyclase (GGDEF)-like protein n=1 Tax=Marinobacterium zhoushanense TaxID=1679163 RepID=A0ABQ1K2H5_9GAMM|nr:diguanylate cyclase [Marinobacterium zhoushanense]GGB84164.1 hypothetical protein GCM10011352_07530 [Marinobacterium zhoushanense]
MDDIIQILSWTGFPGLIDRMSVKRTADEELMESILWGTSEEEISGLLSSISDLIAVIDEERNYRAVSKGYASFFGNTRDELIGRSIDDLHDDTSFFKRVRSGLHSTLVNEQVRFHIWEPDATGDIRYLDCTLTPFPGASAPTRNAIVVARDMTDLTFAQASLAYERKLLQMVINAIPDFIFIKNAEGVYQYCNQAFEKFVSLPEERIVGSSDQDLMSPRSAAYIREQDRKTLEKGEACRIDEWVTYNDGHRRLLDMYKFPIRNDAGQIDGLVGIGRDVTTERLAAERMQQAALVFETTSDCCFILSPEGQVLSANRSAHQAFDYTEEQMAGARLDQLISDVDETHAFSDFLLQQESWRGELIGRDRQGGQWPYIGTLNAVMNAQRQVSSFVLTLTDISEQKELEQELVQKACKDPLTGLPNRLLMRARMEHAIQKAQRNRNLLATVFIDLDGFKAVNDSCGHELGDALLQQIGHRLSQHVRKVDTLARLGGDEFLLLIDDLPDMDTVNIIVDKLLASFETEFRVRDQEVHLSASFGVSFYPTDGMDVDDLVNKADLAMYQAKRTGRNRCCLYHLHVGQNQKL